MRALIIGFGWLGQPLASYLRQHNYTVAGTNRSVDKVAQMGSRGYQSYQFDAFDMQPSQISPDAIVDSKIVINIAPGRKSIDASLYTTALQCLIEYLITHQAQQIVFISTTSVFGDKHGVVSENTAPSPVTQSGIAHAQIEEYLLNKHAEGSVVLRLAGLIGPNADGSLRHPVFSLVKRENLDFGMQKVNLVHQEDVITLIHGIMRQDEANGIFHACAIEHPTRIEYYTWAAKTLGLNTPRFSVLSPHQETNDSKIVDCRQSLDTLGEKLKFASPYDMLSAPRQV